MDDALTIEVGREPQVRTCDRCGRSATDTMGFVYRDGDAYAIYYAAMHRHEDTPQLDLAIGIGTWTNDASVANLSAFLSVWSEAAEVRFGFVDPADSVWANARLLQNPLAANEARSSQSRQALLSVAELVVSWDPAAAGHLD
jgi:hypothetical protein